MSISVKTLPRRVILTDDPLRARMLAAHHLEYSALVYELGDVLVFSGSYKDVPIALASTGFGCGAVLSYLREFRELGAAEVAYIGSCASTADNPASGLTGNPAGNPASSPAGNPSSGQAGNPSRGPTGGPAGNPSRGPAGNPSSGLTGNPAGSPSSGPTGKPAAGCVGLRSVVLAAGGSQSLLNRAVRAAREYGIKATIQTVMPQDGAGPEEGCVVDGVTGALYERALADGVEALSILTVSENTKTGEKIEEHEIRSRYYAAARLVFETMALQ